MAGIGVMFLAITGGEPFLREDIGSIIEEAHSLGFAWKMLTAGTLIGDVESRHIAKNQPLNIDISLHGLEDTHDKMTRVPGSFTATLAAIRRLTNLGVRVIAKMNLTPEGVEDLPVLHEQLSKMGVPLRVATVILPDFDGNPVDNDLCVTDSQLVRHYEYCNRLNDGEGKYGRHRRLTAGEALCNAGRSSFSVSPSGDVRACLSLRKVCGNVRQARLDAIWMSESMAKARMLTAGSRVECEECAYAEYCSYCPGMAEVKDGGILGPAPDACRNARIRKQLAEKEDTGPAIGL
jgi:radical SAM protein with 4Fe4S-binding SPASM domain